MRGAKIVGFLKRDASENKGRSGRFDQCYVALVLNNNSPLLAAKAVALSGQLPPSAEALFNAVKITVYLF